MSGFESLQTVPCLTGSQYEASRTHEVFLRHGLGRTRETIAFWTAWIPWQCLQENIIGVFSLSLENRGASVADKLWSRKPAAVDLSDISLDANTPEGDAYDFLTDTSPAGSRPVLSGDVSFQQGWMCICGTCVCVWCLGSWGLEKIGAFQVTSALTLLLPLTCSVDLDWSLHIYWNNWVWALFSVAALGPVLRDTPTACLSPNMPDISSHVQYRAWPRSVSVSRCQGTVVKTCLVVAQSGFDQALKTERYQGSCHRSLGCNL